MGGENSGELASVEAAKLLQERFRAIRREAGRGLEKGIAAINAYVREANDTIFRLSSSLPGNSGMGTTFAGLLVSGREAAAVNVGDSRVYLYHDKVLRMLTRDHSESERLVRLGLITKEQARTHKSRNMLNRYLGVSPEEGIMEGEVYSVNQISKGDIFLLCSDGLTNLVDDAAIAEIIESGPYTKGVACLLADKAIEKGGSDNVTVITVEVL